MRGASGTDALASDWPERNCCGPIRAHDASAGNKRQFIHPFGSRAALPVSVARDCDVTVRWLVEELVSLDQTLLLVRNLFSTWKDKSVIYVCDLSDNEALMLSYEMLEN